MIEINQLKTNCPNCQTPFHQAHLAEWVKIKGKCPICNTKLTLSLLDPETTDKAFFQRYVFIELRRLEEGAISLTEALELKDYHWEENFIRKISLVGEILKIFPEDKSPRGHLFRKLVIKDEMTIATLQVWGIKRIRHLDKYTQGDFVVIRNPKRPYEYHENMGVDFWVHETHSSISKIRPPHWSDSYQEELIKTKQLWQKTNQEISDQLKMLGFSESPESELSNEGVNTLIDTIRENLIKLKTLRETLSKIIINAYVEEYSDIQFPLSTYRKFLLKAYQTELELNMEFQGLLTHMH